MLTNKLVTISVSNVIFKGIQGVGSGLVQLSPINTWCKLESVLTSKCGVKLIISTLELDAFGVTPLIVATLGGKQVESSSEVHIFPEMSKHSWPIGSLHVIAPERVKLSRFNELGTQLGVKGVVHAIDELLTLINNSDVPETIEIPFPCTKFKFNPSVGVIELIVAILGGKHAGWTCVLQMRPPTSVRFASVISSGIQVVGKGVEQVAVLEFKLNVMPFVPLVTANPGPATIPKSEELAGEIPLIVFIVKGKHD